jgi:hypothetical protein
MANLSSSIHTYLSTCLTLDELKHIHLGDQRGFILPGNVFGCFFNLCSLVQTNKEVKNNLCLNGVCPKETDKI